MTRAILIYNPMSGDHSIINRLDHIIQRFQSRDILIQPFRIEAECENMLVRVLKLDRYDFAVVSGGDGTVNFIVNIILKHGINIPLGIFPWGTSNDLARCLGLPANADELIDIVLGGNTSRIDAGLINDKHYFLSTCAGGVFVDVSFNTHSELKKNFGLFAYYLKALSEVTSIKPFRVTLRTETLSIEEDILLFIILNGKHAAGFYNLIEDADISDGIMDIVLLKSCSHMDLANLFFNVLSSSYINNKNVVKLKAKSCTIMSSSDINVSIDGEKGEGLPMSVSFINKAIEVFVK